MTEGVAIKILAKLSKKLHFWLTLLGAAAALAAAIIRFGSVLLQGIAVSVQVQMFVWIAIFTFIFAVASIFVGKFRPMIGAWLRFFLASVWFAFMKLESTPFVQVLTTVTAFALFFAGFLLVLQGLKDSQSRVVSRM